MTETKPAQLMVQVSHEFKRRVERQVIREHRTISAVLRDAISLYLLWFEDENTAAE